MLAQLARPASSAKSNAAIIIIIIWPIISAGRKQHTSTAAEVGEQRFLSPAKAACASRARWAQTHTHTHTHAHKGRTRARSKVAMLSRALVRL